MRDVLRAPIPTASRLSKKQAEALAKEQIHTVWDLLTYYPYRYQDRTTIYPIGEITQAGQSYQFIARVKHTQEQGYGSKKRLEIDFEDETGEIRCVFFKGGNYVLKRLEKRLWADQKYLVYGQLHVYGGQRSLTHPEITEWHPEQPPPPPVEPIYRTTDSMKRAGLNSRGLARLMARVLEWAYPKLKEFLPDSLMARYHIEAFPWTMLHVHFPQRLEEASQAIGRIKFDELFLTQLAFCKLHAQHKTTYRGHRCEVVGPLFLRMYQERLRFALTGAQQRVLREIRTDMGLGSQMNRLLQGDVGSGKTIVALFSMLLAVDNGLQCVMMAPTEILARQHYATLKSLLGDLPLRLEILTGSTSPRERTPILEATQAGEVDILLGTHALIEARVQFKRLGMVVIDEQQRFGVEQRAKLWRKAEGIAPHVLIMTATPIPRTLALTLYGDLDVSVIDELPPGRKPVRTAHFYERDRAGVNSLLAREIARGRQVYVVFPLIEESETTDLQSLEEGWARIRESFPSLRVAQLHGRVPPPEKDETMRAFARGEIQILVSTTVIEVGVNVPNATVMVIENADRFGLSQLHQLRGRVGRGADESHCILMTGFQLSSDARVRIETLCRTSNGFEIADVDMHLRGSGSLEGTQQSGQAVSFKLANLATDSALLTFCRDRAEEICRQDPNLSQPQHALLREYLELSAQHEGYGKIG